MWSFRHVVRTASLIVAMSAPLLLAACTGFSPVYNSQSFTDQKIAIAFAAPGNRTEQIIYQDLRLRFAKADGPAPTLAVSATAYGTALTTAGVATAQTPQQVTVTAGIKLTDAEGKTLYSGSLAQSADYNTGPQVLANNAAADDATKRAAHLLADTIRLTILGALSK